MGASSKKKKSDVIKPTSVNSSEPDPKQRGFWNRLIQNGPTVAGLTFLGYAAFYIFSYKAKIDTIEKDSGEITKIIKKEVTLRNIYWADIFVYRKDTTLSYYDSTLQYDIVKDTLIYVKKK